MTTPVTYATLVLLVVIFAAHKMNMLRINCANSIPATALRELSHVEFYHIALNAYALYRLGVVEQKVGSPTFLGVMSIIYLLSVSITYIVTKFIHIKCSIGFSGVILGLMAYALITGSEQWNLYPIIYLALSSVGGVNVSVSGHLIGITSGVLVGVAHKVIKLSV